VVIIGTIAIQVYWNYKNYLINKQQFINDVQTSLDNAVDTYYANLAERNTIGFMIEDGFQKNIFSENGAFDSIMERLDFTSKGIEGLDSLLMNNPKGVSVFTGDAADSLLVTIQDDHKAHSIPKDVKFKKIVPDNQDSINHLNLDFLTSKVIISMTQDSLDLENIDSLVKIELSRKKLDLKYGLSYQAPLKQKQHFGVMKSSKSYTDSVPKAFLSTLSRSEFLPRDSILKMNFDNATKQVLMRSSMGMLLSTLLVLAVISSLFYLLKIIKQQKELAEVKNDLISNITHEFKTPIATIGVALESIKSFKVIEDTKRTESYLDMSREQLSKLNIMVEKLLETATLDSDNLNLNREEVNLTDLLNTVVTKHRLQTNEKSISFKFDKEEAYAQLDVFHFENAINNLLDNSMKYGGDKISLTIDQVNNKTFISISDNGNTLTNANRERIFEKFYRIPKGNTHDVKGFGIGLYYTKKIIEKHGGTIQLELKNGLTTFKITIPND
jgi:two-component system phosphate regulon sensor histidine kinase PhoR